MTTKLTWTHLLLLFLLTAATSQADEDDRRFEVLNASNGLADNKAQTLTCTKTGRLIITTDDNVSFYDGTVFVNIESTADCKYRLRGYEDGARVFFDRDHHLWIKHRSWLTCVDLMTESFVRDVAGVLRDMSIVSRVDDLFADHDGGLWVVTDRHIVEVNTKRSFALRQDAVLQELDAFDGFLLLFYNDGAVVGYNTRTNRVVFYSDVDEVLAKNYPHSTALLYNEDAYLQLRTGDNGSVLRRFDMTTHQWRELLNVPFRLNQLTARDNVLYIASAIGYMTYDLTTGQYHHFDAQKLRNSQQEMRLDISDLTFDRQGGLWLATARRGILYSRPHEPPFRVLNSSSPEAAQYTAIMDRLSSNYIPDFRGMTANCMLVDSRRWTWVGTPIGLYLYKSPQQAPIIVSKKMGLLNNVIHTITEDDSHNIWVSTSYGVSVVNIDDEQLTFVNSYNYRDNVPNEMFLNGRAVKLGDGTIAIQSLDHVLLFNPNSFTTNTPKNLELYPKLIKMLVNGKQVETGDEMDGNVILPQAITRTRTIELNSDQNTLSLTFTGLNYFRPLQTYYRVRVKGLKKNDDWTVYSYYNSDGKVDSRGLLHLPLIGLRPGTYVVEVQVSMYPNIWKTKPFEWTINVNEPWWRTTGMFLMLGTLVLIMVGLNSVVFYRNTHLRIERNNREGDVIRRIRNFVERCDEAIDEVLAPRTEEIYNGGVDPRIDLSDDFIRLIMKIIPYIHEHKGNTVTMRQLCEAGEIEMSDMYAIISANIYKSPRMLTRIYKLQKAADMLRDTDKPLEVISAECGFVSPNYFIANFYHQYKHTPRQYREMLDQYTSSVEVVAEEATDDAAGEA